VKELPMDVIEREPWLAKHQKIFCDCRYNFWVPVIGFHIFARINNGSTRRIGLRNFFHACENWHKPILAGWFWRICVTHKYPLSFK
jgi:hypothetical protein